MDNTPFSLSPTAYDIAELQPFLVGLGGRDDNIFNIDMYKTNDAYIVEAELPGIDRSNIEVSVQDKVLCIDVDRVDLPAGEMIVCEIKRGRMVRTVKLPDDIDDDAVIAKCEHGLLRVTVSKQPKKVIIVS